MLYDTIQILFVLPFPEYDCFIWPDLHHSVGIPFLIISDHQFHPVRFPSFRQLELSCIAIEIADYKQLFLSKSPRIHIQFRIVGEKKIIRSVYDNLILFSQADQFFIIVKY